MATLDEARQLALALPETSERVSYGTPAFFAGKILFARLQDNFEILAVKMPFDERDVRMTSQPALFFVTPHYLNWPMVLVHLERIETDELAEILTGAWRVAATKRMLKAFEADRPAS